MGESMAIKVMYIVRIVMCEAERTSGKVREGERVRERRRESERSIWPTSPAGDIRSLARVLVIIGS